MYEQFLMSAWKCQFLKKKNYKCKYMYNVLPLVPVIVSLPGGCCYGDRVSILAVTSLLLLYEGAGPGSGLLGDTE